MKRLCVMLPDRECARQVVDDLVLNKFEENRILVLASDNVSLEDIQDDDFLDTNVAAAIADGERAGGTAGMLAGLPAVTYPPAGAVLGGALLVIASEEKAEIGKILARVFGSSPDSRWREGLDDGEVMISVDAPKGRITEIQRVVRDHHPDASFQAVEPPPPIIGKSQ